MKKGYESNPKKQNKNNRGGGLLKKSEHPSRFSVLRRISIRCPAQQQMR